MSGADGGPGWLDRLPRIVERAVARWGLVLGAPFEGGMSGWAAPGRTTGGRDVVLKVSFPHDEARHEADALAVWHGSGAVEILDADPADWALLLRRLEPGSTLHDSGLAEADQIAVGADLLRRMASAPAPDGPFPPLRTVTTRWADLLEERAARLAPSAPVPVDRDLVARAVHHLRTLPDDAPRTGLVHGDLNPGNILAHRVTNDGAESWFAVDPKPLLGDLAFDPWPLLTQLGDWLTTTAPAAVLADRARLMGDRTGLEAWRIAAWATARSVESALWAADRGWWTGTRGADGDLSRAAAWHGAEALLGRD